MLAFFCVLMFAACAFMSSCSDSSSDDKRDSPTVIGGGGNGNATGNNGNSGNNGNYDDPRSFGDSNLVVSDDSKFSTINVYPDRAISSQDFCDYAEVIDDRLSDYGDEYSGYINDNYISVIVKKSIVGSSVEERLSAFSSIFDASEYDFDVVLDYLDEPNWETDRSIMGMNQTDNMLDGAVIFTYSFDKIERERGRVNSDYFIPFEDSIREKLDSLSIKYMFGTAAYDPYTYCIKVYPEDFSLDFARVIFGENHCNLFTQYGQNLGCICEKVVEVDGGYALQCYIGSLSPDVLINEYNVTNDKIYLVINDVTVASASLSEMYKRDYWYIDFKHFLCFDSPQATEKDINALNMFLVSGRSNIYSSDGGQYGVCVPENVVPMWKYSSMSSEDERVSKIVSEKGHAFSKQIDGRNEIEITIDIPHDKNLVPSFLTAVKEIYTDCNFDGCSYNEIIFKVVDENIENPNDMFRIVAEKDLFNERGMEFNDYCGGPKFDRYYFTFKDSLESDSFFNEKLKEY